MAFQKINAVKILILFLCLTLVFAFPLTCLAAYEDTLEWDGLISFTTSSTRLPMKFTSSEFVFNGTEVLEKSVNATYEGQVSNILKIDNIVPGSVIDGELIIYGSVDTSVLSGTYLNATSPIITFTSDNENNITFGGYIREFPYATVTKFALVIQFNEYYCTNDFINIPFNSNISWSFSYVNQDNEFYYPVAFANLNFAEDWAGDMTMYTNPQSNPSMDGYFADQNQQIIDQSQTQIQNQQIQNQLQEQQNQLQQESNQQNKNFMDNFFGNLGNTVLGWIVPSSDQITTFFTEVNDWFSDRLGFVWYPFDLAFQLVSAFSGGTANTTFKVPAFVLNFQGQKLIIWNSLDIDIDAFGIFQYVRFFTSTLLVCGIVKMSIDKWDEWIGGHNI